MWRTNIPAARSQRGSRLKALVHGLTMGDGGRFEVARAGAEQSTLMVPSFGLTEISFLDRRRGRTQIQENDHKLNDNLVCFPSPCTPTADGFAPVLF